MAELIADCEDTGDILSRCADPQQITTANVNEVNIHLRQAGVVTFRKLGIKPL